jgi:hypothetical protein
MIAEIAFWLQVPVMELMTAAAPAPINHTLARLERIAAEQGW